MNERDFLQMADIAEKRDDDFRSWFRWLVLLAGGALSLLVALVPEDPTVGIVWTFRIASTLFGFGILCGSACLYDLSMTRRRLLMALAAEHYRTRERRASGEDPYASAGPVSAPVARWRRAAERGCYLCLAIGLCSATAFAWQTV